MGRIAGKRKGFSVTGAVLALSLLAETGCLATSVTSLVPSRPIRRTPEQVELFETESPQRLTEPLALLKVQRWIFSDRAAMIRRLREKAAELGGDALIDFHWESRSIFQSRPPGKDEVVYEESWSAVSATVVRYRDPESPSATP